mmetsp:Transcript_55103/g.141912  ORF Transcript_55103/g.141912 Transcript_55103/m.141912 type:complete len:303 (+) Transcript_55103:952-1860(+)
MRGALLRGRGRRVDVRAPAVAFEAICRVELAPDRRLASLRQAVPVVMLRLSSQQSLRTAGCGRLARTPRTDIRQGLQAGAAAAGRLRARAVHAAHLCCARVRTASQLRGDAAHARFEVVARAPARVEAAHAEAAPGRLRGRRSRSRVRRRRRRGGGLAELWVVSGVYARRVQVDRLHDAARYGILEPVVATGHLAPAEQLIGQTPHRPVGREWKWGVGHGGHQAGRREALPPQPPGRVRPRWGLQVDGAHVVSRASGGRCASDLAEGPAGRHGRQPAWDCDVGILKRKLSRVQHDTPPRLQR